MSALLNAEQRTPPGKRARPHTDYKHACCQRGGSRVHANRSIGPRDATSGDPRLLPNRRDFDNQCT